MLEARGHDEPTVMADEAPFAINPDGRKALREPLEVIELRLDDELAGSIDCAPFFAAVDRGKALGKWAKGMIAARLKARGDGHVALLIDVAPAPAGDAVVIGAAATLMGARPSEKSPTSAQSCGMSALWPSARMKSQWPSL
jgi:hypothetical protein